MRFIFDVFHAIMVEAEGLMNSRPFTNLSDALENNEALTPNYFIIQLHYNSSVLTTRCFPVIQASQHEILEER